MKRLQFYALLVTLVFLLLGAVIAAPVDNTAPAANKTALSNEAGKDSHAANPQAVEDPIKMLQKVTNDVLHALQTRRNPNDLKGIYSLVDKYILPYVDFNEMSQWVAGRKIWNKATDQQRAEFMDAFKILVVRTYATALNSYTNERVEFGKQKFDLKKDRIQVSSTIVRQSAKQENIHLDYRLIKKDNKWYVYDIIIEGVSILQGFQAQFSNDIRQKGLPQVITQIQQHNRETNV